MCRRVTCRRCGAPTYAGCGRHIEEVLWDVPEANRCQCRSQPRPEGEGGVAAFFKRLVGK